MMDDGKAAEGPFLPVKRLARVCDPGPCPAAGTLLLQRWMELERRAALSSKFGNSRCKPWSCRPSGAAFPAPLPLIAAAPSSCWDVNRVTFIAQVPPLSGWMLEYGGRRRAACPRPPVVSLRCCGPFGRDAGRGRRDFPFPARLVPPGSGSVAFTFPPASSPSPHTSRGLGSLRP